MGSGGKTQAPTDNTAALYQQQQADLAKQKAEMEAKEQAARDAEQAKREQLRQQMLGERIETEDAEDASIEKNILA